ncbi:hypothetical protein PX701_18485 [Agromyces sp. H3Y2-19a]|uniref:hypothetical protein n=1 Tax=Agromyces chromiiresistens TaxID=3030835 RepID=UPI0023B8A54B|nr:hypothetical protein [Agromyces chromiiresistens]MDF0515615.1 hypothetical protein [Agromyces chromiiresistens]
MTIGETAGFAIAAGVAIGASTLGVSDPWRYLLVVFAGAVEGTVLGGAQLIGMGGGRPDAAKWLVATATGAALAWSIGMLPTVLPLQFVTPIGFATAAVAALMLLASIPTLQWAVIRRRKRAGRWIPVNAGAWAAGVLWTIAPSPLIDESTPTGVLVAVYVAAGLLMAGTVAVLTATTARSLFGHPVA